ncbi:MULTISPECIES: YHYH domain-containing protein [Vibrio]|uniref:YHYH domain-containing protein n=1 Tax=Vibrio TaxID=662 RepID=UPI001EFDCA2C|nr:MULTISPECIES: YHYH domain-containing protein [Vibrio]MCF4172732.1 YHYH domain-containing protein [Vibrio sp. McD22-P3]MCG9661427.1 YHYH domain-containing protein [Vibrio mediterranei]MCG9786811.1 YHYH domain-containing protein [Vibrio mediterranei]MCY9874119.1 YHYH domain-containing protein [Vibrio barjaei]
MKYCLMMLVAIFTGTLYAQPVSLVGKVELSHSGGTDSCGCHYNRKTGEYHCHTRKQRGGSCPP